MAEWAFADELEQATKWCATFCAANWTPERGYVPRPDEDSATVTFVEVTGRTYAVTAFHVIEGFRHQHPNLHGFSVPTAPGVGMLEPFVRPPATLVHPAPDVALRPVHPDLPERVGKAFFRLERSEPNFPVPYALAAGFPTSMKSAATDRAGREHVALPGVIAAAEGVGSSSEADQLQFFSEVDASALSGDVSGLSGGPVFWSDGIAYGLLGFVKEAMPANSGAPKVHFVCQRASFETFCAWADFVDRQYPVELEKLNVQAREQLELRRGE